jgi:lipoprotein-releasing system ATP-binding protein
MSDPLVLVGVVRTYRTEAGELHVLRGADLALHAGEIVALVAPSGTGKSTLLHLAGLLEQPDAGSVLVDGRDAGQLPDAERTAIRRETIGFVYQFHHLLAEFSALENVVLPQMIAGKPLRQARARASYLLSAMGLGERLEHLPGKLSGGNLDEGTAEAVFEELLYVVRNHGVAALIGTHNFDLAARMDRRVTLHEGRIVPF